MPAHMHLNVELLECVQLTVSALLEVPLLVAGEHDPRRKSNSKHFRRMYDQAQQQVYNGPPESHRDAIMLAARELAVGNWRRARDLLLSVTVWDSVPHADEMRVKLVAAVKEEAVHTYLLQAGQHY